MLKYLVSVTKDLLMPGILLGLLYAYIYKLYGPKGRKILTIGTIAGFAASIVMSVVKNRTRLVDLGMWNVRTFTVSLAALVLFFVFRALAKKGKGGSAVPVLAAILAFTLIFYAMPDIYALPFDFNLGGASLYSTAFFFRLIGFLLGVVVSFLACLAVDHAGKRLSPGLLGAYIRPLQMKPQKTGSLPLIFDLVIDFECFQKFLSGRGQSGRKHVGRAVGGMKGSCAYIGIGGGVHEVAAVSTVQVDVDKAVGHVMAPGVKDEAVCRVRKSTFRSDLYDTVLVDQDLRRTDPAGLDQVCIDYFNHKKPL